jgi:hypothetical protein
MRATGWPSFVRVDCDLYVYSGIWYGVVAGGVCLFGVRFSVEFDRRKEVSPVYPEALRTRMSARQCPGTVRSGSSNGHLRSSSLLFTSHGKPDTTAILGHLMPFSPGEGGEGKEVVPSSVWLTSCLPLGIRRFNIPRQSPSLANLMKRNWFCGVYNVNGL